MTDEDFMKLAIEVAIDAEASGGAPLGAIIVKAGEVVAKGGSKPGEKRDPSNHGEMDCIRACSRENNLLDMAGCTMYGTVEPCSMCVGAALWAGLDRLVFGAYAGDIAGNEYEYDDYSSEQLVQKSRKAADPRRGKVEITGGVLREKCKNLLKDYQGWTRVG